MEQICKHKLLLRGGQKAFRRRKNVQCFLLNGRLRIRGNDATSVHDGLEGYGKRLAAIKNAVQR